VEDFMRKFLDKIIQGVSPEDDDQYNDVFEEDEIYGDSGSGMGDLSDIMISGGYSPSPYGNPIPNPNQGGFSNNNNNNHQQPQQPVYPQQPPPPPVNTGSGITVSGGNNMQLAVELKIVKPEDYQDVTQIADHLINRKTVILNLEETNKETARRLLDFLSGVAYTIQGQIERVADRTFVITPSNIGISSDQLKDDIRKNTGRADGNTIIY
jgi:cell division inhibitor SepF